MVPILIVLVIGLFFFLFFRVRNRESYIRNYKFPQGLNRRLSKHHHHLTPEQFKLVVDGLRQFFVIYLKSGRKSISMPSQAVDDLWHEFILYTKAYQTFCHKAFGQFLHHTPAVVMTPSQKKSNAGLKRAWFYACRDENIAPNAALRLPLIFALDAQLNIANGFHYVPDCKRIGQANNTVGIYCGGDFANSSCGTSCSSSSDSDSGCSGSDGCSGGCGGGGD